MKNKFVYYIGIILAWGMIAAAADEKQNISVLRVRADGSDKNAAFELYKLAAANKLHKNANESREAAERYLFRAAELGHVQARFIAANSVLYKLPLQKGQTSGVQWLMDDVVNYVNDRNQFTPQERGRVFLLLAQAYEYGKGVYPSALSAFRYYLLASMDDQEAKLDLARLFYLGNAAMSRADKEMGMRWAYSAWIRQENLFPDIFQMIVRIKAMESFQHFLEKKGLQGDANAAYLLGETLIDGRYFPRDRQGALKWYEKAVKSGSTRAMLRLALIYRDGLHHVKRDEDKAAELLHLALINPETEVAAAREILRNLNRREKNILEAKQRTPAMESDLKMIRQEKFRLLMICKDYTEAAKICPPDITGPGLYLKAKVYQKNMKPGKTSRREYARLLLYAFNAGYPLAVREYYEIYGPRDPERMIKSLLANPEPDDPRYLWQLSTCYVANKKKNALYSPEKSKEYLIKAAEAGSLPALDMLIRAYRSGNQLLEIEPNAQRAARYTDDLVRRDVKMQYPVYFQQYLDNLSRYREMPEHALDPFFCSAEVSPAAAYTLGMFYLNGNSKFKIERDFWKGFSFMHLSSELAPNKTQPLQLIEKAYAKGVPDVINPDKLFADYYKARIRSIHNK